MAIASITAIAISARAFDAYSPWAPRWLAAPHRRGHTAARLAPACRARALSAVKPLLSFGVPLGLLPFNAGAVLRLPRQRAHLSPEQSTRTHALLCLLCIIGIRVSEVAGLRWRGLQEREEDGQMTVYGKAGKTRSIPVPALVWAAGRGIGRQNARSVDVTARVRS